MAWKDLVYEVPVMSGHLFKFVRSRNLPFKKDPFVFIFLFTDYPIDAKKGQGAYSMVSVGVCGLVNAWL